MSDHPAGPGIQVFERGWLSANNILLQDRDSAVLVDSGYVAHAPQTLALVRHALQGRPLNVLVNTHLHSDHCGGNAALQDAYPELRTWIAPGQAEPVSLWNQQGLSYQPTGQNCPRFAYTDLLQPGSSHRWADTEWQVHAAPGHDPHSVILFAPEHRLLLSADALWEHGFGVVFPELEDVPGFDAVARTLDLIESLQPRRVIPGHGPQFDDVQGSLARARARLDGFVRAPDKHKRHGAKVLIKFKMLEFGRIARPDFMQWASTVPYLVHLHQHHAAQTPMALWLQQLLAELAHSGALQIEGDALLDGG